MSNREAESVGVKGNVRPYQSFNIERLGLLALRDGSSLFVVGVRSEVWAYQGPTVKLAAKYAAQTDEVSFTPTGIAKSEASRLLGEDGLTCLKIISDATVGIPLSETALGQGANGGRRPVKAKQSRPQPRRLLTLKGVSFSSAGIAIGLDADQSDETYYDGYVDRLYDGLARSSVEWMRGWLPVYVPNKPRKSDGSSEDRIGRLAVDPLVRDKPNLAAFLERQASLKRLAEARQRTEQLARLKAQEEFYRTKGGASGGHTPDQNRRNDLEIQANGSTDNQSAGNVERSQTLHKMKSA